jgi:hypothetical protein
LSSFPSPIWLSTFKFVVILIVSLARVALKIVLKWYRHEVSVDTHGIEQRQVSKDIRAMWRDTED